MGFFGNPNHNHQDNRSCCSDDSNGIGNDVFRSISKHAAVFCVWKIEGLGAIAVPRNQIGTFLTNAAYVIYTVTPKGSAGLPYPGMPTKDIKGPVFRSIHFWIGKCCDATISGCAALRAAELDAQVSATILNREFEGRESPRFLSYFLREKIVVLRSQKSSINDHNTINPTLYKITGVSIPILTELDAVAWQNFSSSDVMILEVSSEGVIFIWIGSSSSPLHKKHATKITDVKKENNNNIRIVIIDDGYEQTIGINDKKLFSQYLDPSSRILSSPKSDKPFKKPSPIKLYKCSEQSGKYKVAELKSGPIFRSDLSQGSVFLIDRGEAGVFAWVGKEVNAKEKIEAVRNARGFIKKKGYSSGTPVARVSEGEEPVEIKWLIKGWENERTRSRALILPVKFDPDYMIERPKISADCQLVDDGSGDKILWNVGNNLNNKIDNDCGIYYAENCYVMQYGYGAGRKSRIIIYCWKGAHSTSIDRDAAVEFASKLGEEMNGELVISSQGKEPPHLLQIYGGKLTILCGKHKEKAPSKYLVRVYGSTPYTSKAVEKPLRGSSLDSSGVFILFSSSPFVWCGGKSTGDSREASRRLAPITTPLIAEGNEDDEFWEQLQGGRSSYSSETTEASEELENRLYHCEVEEDCFIGTEILGFTQQSLIPEASWLLDTGNTIFVWIGNYSTTKNLRESIKMAEIFLYNHPSGRDRNTTITAIRQGFEPPTFTGIFDSWNQNHLRDHQSFNVFRTLLKTQESTASNNAEDLKTETISSNFDKYIKYPLKILTKNDPENLPEGVDVQRKELHLTYDDFIQVFKLKPSEFDKLPSWRRQRLKQTAGLF